MPNSGSFIRYNPASISLGQTFGEALKRKYVDDSISTRQPEQATSQRPSENTGGSRSHVEHIILGSSKGRIGVEAPGIDKVRRKVANIERLREISLDGEGVASAEEGEDEDGASIWNLCRSMSRHLYT